MIDDARFERMYAEHGPAVLRYCAYSLGSRGRAEDVAAEVFARFLERGDRVGDEAVEAWLIRVSRNLCVSHHRAEARDRRLVDRMGHAAQPSDAWSDSDWWTAIQSLSEVERLAIYLRVVRDLPFSDVARVMRKREGAVKMTFYRAVEKLRVQHGGRRPGADARLSGGVSYE